MVDAHLDALSKILQDVRSGGPPSGSSASSGRTGARINSKNVFRHPDAHPLVLDLLLIHKYGQEWLGWEPETLEIRIPKDFAVDRLSEMNLSKLQAMKTLHLVDAYWERWEIFVWCTMPLNGIFPDFQLMQVPTVAQCMMSVDIANRVRSDVEWSDELKDYLSVVHRHNGILVPQPPVAFVQVDTSLLPIDIQAVTQAWPSIRASKVPPKDMTAESEQLRRMAWLHEVLEQHRAQLREQLQVLRDV